MTRKLFALLALLFSSFIASAQIVTVTASAGSLSGGYNTLKATFDAINAGTHKGVIAISINADCNETASAVLNASGTGSSSYTSISVQPAQPSRSAERWRLRLLI